MSPYDHPLQIGKFQTFVDLHLCLIGAKQLKNKLYYLEQQSAVHTVLILEQFYQAAHRDLGLDFEFSLLVVFLPVTVCSFLCLFCL